MTTRRPRLAGPLRWLLPLAILAGIASWGVHLAGSADDSQAPPYGPEAAVRTAPSAIPDRIILTWSADPAASQSVTWRTDASVTAAFAEVARAQASPDFYQQAQWYRAETTALHTSSGPAHFHSVTFTGLAPNTLYAYRVGSDEACSEWFQFRTAANEPAPFRFIYLGDAQNNVLAMWSRTIRAAYGAAPDARFLLHAGDLVNHGDNDRDWAEWFHAGGWIFATIPSILVAGNHEYYRIADAQESLTRHWQAQFTLPENGAAQPPESSYFIDYQGLRMIVLNSCEQLELQTAWLQETLASNPHAWTIVSFHHPIYSSAGGRDNPELRALWKPLFEQYRVDLVLQGHDHTYARGQHLPSLDPRQRKAGRPVYIVSVSGPKMYELPAERWMDRAAENMQLYQIISIDGDLLRYEAYAVTGELYDAFELVKRPDGTALLDERR